MKGRSTWCSGTPQVEDRACLTDDQKHRNLHTEGYLTEGLPFSRPGSPHEGSTSEMQTVESQNQVHANLAAWCTSTIALPTPASIILATPHFVHRTPMPVRVLKPLPKR